MAFWKWSVLLMTQSTTLTWTHSLSATPGSYLVRFAGISNVGFSFKQPHVAGSGTNHVLLYMPGIQDPTPIQVEVQVLPTDSIVAS